MGRRRYGPSICCGTSSFAISGSNRMLCDTFGGGEKSFMAGADLAADADFLVQVPLDTTLRSARYSLVRHLRKSASPASGAASLRASASSPASQLASSAAL